MTLFPYTTLFRSLLLRFLSLIFSFLLFDLLFLFFSLSLSSLYCFFLVFLLFQGPVRISCVESQLVGFSDFGVARRPCVFEKGIYKYAIDPMLAQLGKSKWGVAANFVYCQMDFLILLIDFFLKHVVGL